MYGSKGLCLTCLKALITDINYIYMGGGGVAHDQISDIRPPKKSNIRCDIFGVNHIWLQSDAAFVYRRLD